MNSRCSVCRHPNRTEIEKALAAGVALRKLAGQFAVSKDAARRHRLHMAEIPDPLAMDVPPCPVHGQTAFRFYGSQWVCGAVPG